MTSQGYTVRKEKMEETGGICRDQYSHQSINCLKIISIPTKNSHVIEAG